jgi:hypothetical protein
MNHKLEQPQESNREKEKKNIFFITKAKYKVAKEQIRHA